MARAADDIQLDEQQRRLFAAMAAHIDGQSDGFALMSITQDLVSELLRRADDGPLRERTLGEVSRFFLGIIKAPGLSEKYKMDRLKAFARATVKILLDGRVLTPPAPSAPPPGLARRCCDGAGAPH